MVVGPLLFNIYNNDIFIFKKETDITNYADDNTPFVCCSNETEVISKLKHDAKLFIQWFKDNGLWLNEDKCKLIILSKQENNSALSLENEVITIDHKLTFNEHVENLCIKANKKLHALARICNYMSKDKLRIIMKAFVTSHFGYFPLVWLFHS